MCIRDSINAEYMGLYMKEERRKDKKDNKVKKDFDKELTRDFTINLKKRLYKIQFKKRGKRAVRELRKFASKQMRVQDIRVDTDLNQFLWKRGIRNIPDKVRVRISKKKNEDEEAKEGFFCTVQHVDVEDFSGLRTENAKAQYQPHDSHLS
eukprot:TRINITY_DN480_c0_g1_i11.p1 TRINITY_DN480_c0_g1~~TRINITY_DN480_c0_g1_i11.p1  ORF type:complete len:151 (+),score=30.86 TRINITY_DN480_c0_g1_i11:76-528(+)